MINARGWFEGQSFHNVPAPPKPKIVTEWNGLGWSAVREDYDLGHPVGMSTISEAEAIADLLEWEELRA